MFYTIKNEHLEVSVNSFGAELSSVKAKDGYEYMWQVRPRNIRVPL